MGRRKTAAERAWLRERYGTMPNARLLDAFEAEFGWRMGLPSLQSWASDEGVTRPVRYTDEENDFLRGFIPGHTEREISDAFEERFGRPLTGPQVGNRKSALGVRSGTHGGRFERGGVPANKGRSWDDQGIPEEVQERMRSGQFRRGQLPHTTRPLLAMRRTKDGYLQIHVGLHRRERANDQWISYASFVWMQANGRDWPDNCRAVFADHDSENYDPDNIVPVPNDLYPIVQGAVRGGVGYHDRETLEAAIVAARVTRARTALVARAREAGR